jgi:hypothetical protein
MSSQLLIYETAVPVSHARHGKWSIDISANYGFSKNVNSVPLMAVEFPNAASEYAIVFAGTNDAFIPVTILGMRPSENLYLTNQGGWEAKYVPAFVRRYPFVFSRSADGKSFTLCVDEAFAGFNQDGRGEQLFDVKLQPTPYVANVLKFLEQYQIQFRRTQSFCNKLRDLKLLEPMRAQANLEGGEQLSLVGFLAVNRERLKALPAEAVSDLLKTDELELLYLHLHSMRHFSAMAERLRARGAAADGTEPAAPASPPQESGKAAAKTAPSPQARQTIKAKK